MGGWIKDYSMELITHEQDEYSKDDWSSFLQVITEISSIRRHLSSKSMRMCVVERGRDLQI